MTRAHHSHSDDLVVYGTYMAASAARSLELLRKIERTNLALRSIASDTNLFAETIEDVTRKISDAKASIAEDEILPVYEDLQDRLESLHRTLRRKCAVAKGDHRVCDEDGLYDSFEHAMEAVDRMHHSIEMFRWVVMENNADRSESAGEVLSSPEDVEKFLMSI